MALSNWNAQDGDKTFINLKLVSEAWPTKEQPKFEVLGEDFKPTGDTYTELKGKLIKIVGTHTPPKGKRWDVYGFKAFFEDGEEIYVVESTLTNASKDLLNALLVNIQTVLKVNLYLNKNWYPTSSVKLEDGNWAQTSMEYNQIDVTKLYEAIEIASPKQSEASEELAVEDIPF